MQPIALALALTFAALPAAAQNYNLSAEFCGNMESDSTLTITPDSVNFHESSCTIVSQSKVTDGVRDVALACTGEGEEWDMAVRIQETAQGVSFLGLSGEDPIDYVRCD